MCNPGAAPETTAAVSSQVSKRATVAAEVSPDAEYFAGVIKSYNERRGFGFLACDETAQRFGRDVYLSKVESSAAIQEGEEPLKEGDHVMFAVVLSIEGFPQAAGAQRLHIVRGTVLSFCREQGATIACEAAEGAVPKEVIALPSDCGRLLLYPGDEVSFCVEDVGDGSVPLAKLLRLVNTARPPSALLSCFILEFPRDGQKPVFLNGHAFSSCICLSNLPSDIGEAKITQFFSKVGAKQVTVAHSPSGGFASVVFPEVSDVNRFLATENHSFTDQSNTEGATSLVRLHQSQACGTVTLPALSPPALLQGEAGGVLVIWEPVSLAAAYRVEIRTAGAGGWSPVDAAGRVQPAGAAPLLGLQNTRLAIGGLSAGVPYEARVSYVASCGCQCIPSDISCICTSGFVGQAPPPPPVYGAPISPCSPPLCAPVPLTTDFHSSQAMQLQGPLPPAPAPPSAPMMHFQVPPPPQFPYMYGAPMMQVPAVAMLPPLPQPEVIISHVGNAISVRWTNCGPPAASYVVEVFDYALSASNRFGCPAPVDGATRLELCIQGLQAGQSYVACVRSVAHDGMESPPSPWSRVVALPLANQTVGPAPCDNTPAQHVHSPSEQQQQQQQPSSPHAILNSRKSQEMSAEKAENLVAGVAPEITGHEDMGLFLD